ncbi:universal stress protein [Desulfonatronum thioautotrophicum]|uniref:universal stress protein n=1 Tax=Desulfonatronum thioautotrophicum TaxID=617001 RepID=UPI0005EB5559|nr:universal stress protein [Desulfonatronum thioautotrophicum]
MNFKKLLVAVDASENSARAVAYVGEMVGNTRGFHVTLLYVERFPERDTFPNEDSWRAACQKEEKTIRDFLEDSRRQLVNSGIAPEHVTVEYASASSLGARRSEGYSVARHVLQFHQEGGFGTVVVGRRGVSKAEEFLFGSVTTKIVHSAKDCTIWVVQ